MNILKSLNETFQDENKEQQMEGLYRRAVRYYFQSQPSCNVEECILNTMTPLLDYQNQSIISPFLGRTYYDEKIDQNIIKKMLWNPLEIIKIGPSEVHYVGAQKCFTYFSHFQTFWEKIRIIRHEGFVFLLKLDKLVYPFHPDTSILFSIHSPNTLPTSEDMNTVNPRYMNIISYSKWKVERLGKGYDTNCRQYKTEVFSRNECIFDCYQKRMKQICKTNGFIKSYLYTKIDYFKNRNLSMSICENDLKYDPNVTEDPLKFCQGYCPIECHFTYYFTTIDKSLRKYPTLVMVFKHSSMPDIYVRHIPEMPLMTFICNFGGLLGMWLGVAFIDIVQHLWHKLLRNYFSYQCFSNFFKNNVTINCQSLRLFMNKINIKN